MTAPALHVEDATRLDTGTTTTPPPASLRTPAPSLRGFVVTTLIGRVPLADGTSLRSGLAIGPDGRKVRLALYAVDGRVAACFEP